MKERFFRNRTAVFTVVFVLLVGLVGILAPVIAPNDPYETNILNKFASYSLQYPLGTDQLGRCVLSRMIYGIRPTLGLALLTMFGTALSSCVNFFLSTDGQASAVGTIISAGYGFICGAYMPISNFGDGLQKVLSFLPGTYGTSLLRNHAMRGAFEKMRAEGFPQEVVEGIRDSVDCNLYFFGNEVSVGAMYGILIGSIVLLTAVYAGMNILSEKRQG